MKKHKCKFHAIGEIQKIEMIEWRQYFIPLPFADIYCKFVCEICGKVKYVKIQEEEKEWIN